MSGGVIERTQTPEVLIPEARSRQRRRQQWITAVIIAAALVTAIGLWMSRSSTPSSHRIVHGASPRRPPPPSSPASPVLNRPVALAIAPNGELLIVNQGTNQVLRRLPDGNLQVVAGTGVAGYSGDGGPAVQAELNMPNGIAVAPDGTIYIADTFNNRIRAISPSGIISTVAGTGTPHGVHPGVGPFGGPATEATMTDPISVALGPDGLYLATGGGTGIQVVSPNGVLLNVPLSGVDTGGSAPTFGPNALAVDGAGNIYAADFSSKALFEFSPSGTILHTWKDVYVTEAGLATASDDSILVADYGGFSVDRISNGQLTHLATFSLDSVPGVVGAFRPSGVTITSGGTLYVDTDGANGGTNTPAIGTLRGNGQLQVIASGPNVS
jgi:sugar lactone lactonase YvrE